MEDISPLSSDSVALFHDFGCSSEWSGIVPD
jgi:hypothetical protein